MKIEQILDIAAGVCKIVGIVAACVAALVALHFILWMGYYSGMPM